MAPAPAITSTPRHVTTRGRSTRNSLQHASSDERLPMTEPPLKRRRYISGGPASGSRHSSSVDKSALMQGKDVDDSRATDHRTQSAQEPNFTEPPATVPARPRRESRRDRTSARPRFSSAAAAAAAVAQGDGFKPREERGWEEFHEDLDIEVAFPVFSSREVDGSKFARPQDPQTPQSGRSIGNAVGHDGTPQVNGQASHSPVPDRAARSSASPAFTPKRKAGRPFRRVDAMLKGIGISPDSPKMIPPPGFNPREKLTLPKPSFQPLLPFERFRDQEQSVDQAMANVGFQRSELWNRPQNLIRVTEGNIEDDLLLKGKANEKEDGTGIGPGGVGRVEYDMDEQDTYWLNAENEIRLRDGIPDVKPWVFEVVMTKIEKEWHALEKRIPKPNPKPPQTHRPRSSSAAAVNGELATHGEEQDTKCAICDDGDCENTNAIVFCDGCDLAVHQECYGVPFIPEGQWLCRKCQLIGRGTPTCIFCPNTDGAFKQTNASRWAHLLCAIWIPEVSIGNPTFMEPVMEVEKVPKQRWKLTCYICRQKMGACIQCGNKNCYIAFHVSCARRARLFLKMKSTHGSPATLDASVLKAFCDKHVPADWRREYDVDRAIVDAMEHYRHTMRGRLWADSQQAALTAVPPPMPDLPFDGADSEEAIGNPKITLKFGNKTITRPQPPKIVWKLPSGAPVIPKALYDSIESSLQRFAVQKRKDFAAEVCKYWTLKREARRGAALLKRLQLQMETFTSMEIPRRNFVGMGAAGRVRLQRRIDFADILLQDVDKLKDIWSLVVQREQEKYDDSLNLKTLVDTIYFPLNMTLTPILHTALAYDNTGAFGGGLSRMHSKVEKRAYDSVIDFAKDLVDVVNQGLLSLYSAEQNNVLDQDGHPTPSKSRSNQASLAKASARRIIRGSEAALGEGVRQQNDLHRTDPAADLAELKTILDSALLTRTQLSEITGLSPSKSKDAETSTGLSNGINHDDAMDVDGPKTADAAVPETPQKGKNTPRGSLRRLRADPISKDVPTDEGPTMNGINGDVANDTPGVQDDDATALVNGDARPGGIPWYLKEFQPKGISVLEVAEGEAPQGGGENETDGKSGFNTTDTNAEKMVNGGSKSKSANAAKKKTASRKRKR